MSAFDAIGIAINALFRAFDAKVRHEEARARIKAYRRLEAEAAHRAAVEESKLMHAEAKRRRAK